MLCDTLLPRNLVDVTGVTNQIMPLVAAHPCTLARDRLVFYFSPLLVPVTLPVDRLERGSGKLALLNHNCISPHSPFFSQSSTTPLFFFFFSFSTGPYCTVLVNPILPALHSCRTPCIPACASPKPVFISRQTAFSHHILRRHNYPSA